MGRTVDLIEMQSEIDLSFASWEAEGARYRRNCRRYGMWVLKSLSLSHNESGDGWKNFAFSTVSLYNGGK